VKVLELIWPEQCNDSRERTVKEAPCNPQSILGASSTKSGSTKKTELRPVVKPSRDAAAFDISR
jgi:hypothetical protein